MGGWGGWRGEIMTYFNIFAYFKSHIIRLAANQEAKGAGQTRLTCSAGSWEK